MKKTLLLPPISTRGKVLEWLKRHAWKACKPLKGFVGSNPILSAGNTNKNWSFGAFGKNQRPETFCTPMPLFAPFCTKKLANNSQIKKWRQRNFTSIPEP